MLFTMNPRHDFAMKKGWRLSFPREDTVTELFQHIRFGFIKAPAIRAAEEMALQFGGRRLIVVESSANGTSKKPAANHLSTFPAWVKQIR